MKSHQKSIGKFCLVVVLVASAGCASSGSSGGSGKSGTKDDLGNEISLKSDRSQLSDLRKEVPEAVQQENDELALLLKLMGETKDQPYVVREKWAKEVRKRRDVFEKWVRETRQKYTDTDLKNRTAVLKNLETTRIAFTKEKHTSQERTDFFNDADSKRRTYFSEERDRREDFESKMRDKRRDFDDYMRERQAAFEQEYRDYTKRYDEAKKEKERLAKEKQKAAASGGGSTSASAYGAGASAQNGEAPGPRSGPADVDPDLLEFQKRPKTQPIQLNSGQSDE